MYAFNAYNGSGNNAIIAPASDGGLLVQGINDDKGVQINLSEWPNSKVTVNECSNSRIHFYGSCGDLVLVRCQNILVLSDGVSTSISIADCEQTNVAIGGNVPPVSIHRSKNSSLMAALDMLREPLETHTCTGITLHALHEAIPNITAEELLEQRMNAEVVEILDGIGLLQRSPVGWHRYQHLIRKAGIGLLLEVKGPDLWGDGRNGFLVKSLIEGYPAQQSGALQVGDELLAVDDHDITGWSLNKVGETIAGPVGTWCKLSVARFGRPLPTPVMILRSPPAKARGSRVLAEQTIYDSGRHGQPSILSQLYGSGADPNNTITVSADGKLYASQPQVPRPATGVSYENSYYRENKSRGPSAVPPPDPAIRNFSPPGLQHLMQPYEQAALLRSQGGGGMQPDPLAQQVEQQQQRIAQLESALLSSSLQPAAPQPGPVTDPRIIPAPSQPPTNSRAVDSTLAAQPLHPLPAPTAQAGAAPGPPVEMTVAVMEGRNFGSSVSAESKLAVALQMQVPQQQAQNCRTAAKTLNGLSWQEEFKFMIPQAGAQQAVLKCAVVDWGREPIKGEITGFLKDMELNTISRDVVLDGWYPVSTAQSGDAVAQVRLRMYLPSMGALPPAAVTPPPAQVPQTVVPAQPTPRQQTRVPPAAPQSAATSQQDPAQAPRRQVRLSRNAGPVGSKTGIGINFARTQPHGYYQITSLLPQGMAEQSGELSAGSYLWGVDGVDIVEQNIGQVAELIKGSPGSHVTLTVS